MIEGGCRCGALRYTLDSNKLPIVYACHCQDCQTMSGGSVALQAPLPLARINSRGELIDWVNLNSRGKTTIQRFCATCKTRIYSTNDDRPGIAILRAGTLDASAELVPAVHMWVKRKQLWIGLPFNSEAYEENIPLQRFMTLIGPNFA